MNRLPGDGHTLDVAWNAPLPPVLAFGTVMWNTLLSASPVTLLAAPWIVRHGLLVLSLATPPAVFDGNRKLNVATPDWV